MMMSEDADEWGSERQKGRRSGKSGKSGAQELQSGSSGIDWGLLHDEVLRKFEKGPARRTERAIGCVSAADAVQSAMADLFALNEAGDGPQTHDELAVMAEKEVRRRLSTVLRSEKRHAVKLSAHASTFTSGDLFEMICQRDEQRKFFARMYEEAENDPEAKQVLILVLEQDLPYKQTLLLAQILSCMPNQVTNIKKRLVRMGAKIMKELTEPNPKGDGR